LLGLMQQSGPVGTSRKAAGASVSQAATVPADRRHRTGPPRRLRIAQPKRSFYGGFGPALAGGLLAGAVIGGIASSAYAWGPGYYEAPMCRGFGRLAVGELDRVDSLDHRTWCRMMRDRGRCAYPPLAIASFALVVPKTRAAPPGSSRPILPAGVNSQSFNTSLSGYCA
jgi:hypothetical protein